MVLGWPRPNQKVNETIHKVILVHRNDGIAVHELLDNEVVDEGAYEDPFRHGWIRQFIGCVSDSVTH